MLPTGKRFLYRIYYKQNKLAKLALLALLALYTKVHSYRSDSTGSAPAALRDWKLTVKTAMHRAVKPDKTKIQTSRLLL